MQAVVTRRVSGFGQRLDAHFATVRLGSFSDALKRSAANWPIYAAVTGSALATATAASAGTIIWSGVQDVTAGPIASVGQSTRVSSSKNVVLVNGVGFRIGVEQASGEGAGGAAYLRGGFNTNAFLIGGGYILDKLAPRATISAGAGRFGFEGFAGTEHFGGGNNGITGWTASRTGFAGFEFKTQTGKSSTSFAKAIGAQIDFGWVRLEYTVGQNGLSNSIEAIDWAYDSSGAPINAGDEGLSATPEPSTVAMALLAAGAAGIAALRRRRKQTAR